MAEHIHPGHIQGRVQNSEMVDGRGDVRKCSRPTAAVAETAVLDVPDGPATGEEIAGKRAHHDPAVALAPRAAVDQDHHRVGAGARRQVQIPALRAVGTIAVGEPAREEEVTDQADVCHAWPS